MIHPLWPIDAPISIKASSGLHNDDAAPIIDKSWLRNYIRQTPGKDTPSSSQTTESWRTHKLGSKTTTLGISSMMKGMVVSVKADNKSAAFNKDFGEVEAPSRSRAAGHHSLGWHVARRAAISSRATAKCHVPAVYASTRD